MEGYGYFTVMLNDEMFGKEQGIMLVREGDKVEGVVNGSRIDLTMEQYEEYVKDIVEVALLV